MMAQQIKNSPAVRRHRRCWFDLWAGKIPWRKKWQPTPVFLPGESHGQRSLVVTVHGIARVGHDLVTETHSTTQTTFRTVSVEWGGRRHNCT